MCELENDILIEIPDEDLPDLAKLYKDEAPWAPQMFSFVNTMIKWKANDKFNKFVTFWSPNNCWRQDGTIIVLVSLFGQEVHLFTLDDKCTNLYEGLLRTSRIDYRASSRTMYLGVLEKFMPLVNKVIAEKSFTVTFNVPCIIYAISPDQARAFSINCSSEVYIKQLVPSLAKQVNDLWPHRFPNSVEYVTSYIEINGGYGVFLRETDEMVAWIVKHAYGHLALLQTEENYKKRGYATLVTKMLSKEIAEEGHWPLATILTNNEVSKNLFEKLGFKPIGICSFIGVQQL